MPAQKFPPLPPASLSLTQDFSLARPRTRPRSVGGSEQLNRSRLASIRLAESKILSAHRLLTTVTLRSEGPSLVSFHSITGSHCRLIAHPRATHTLLRSLARIHHQHLQRSCHTCVIVGGSAKLADAGWSAAAS